MLFLLILKQLVDNKDCDILKFCIMRNRQRKSIILIYILIVMTFVPI